jgi:hypothetical protein
MLARMDPIEDKGNKDGQLVRLMQMAHKEFPGLFPRMMLSPTEARRHNRELGLKPLPGQTHQETSAVRVPEEIHEAVCVLARKLAKGVFYREVGNPFPNAGCLLLNWFTNTELIRSGKYQVFDLLKHLRGDAPPLQRSGKFLNDQFEFKVSLAPEKNIIVLQCRFGNSFGMVVFGSAVTGQLEDIVMRLREESKRLGPFAVLQSAVLAS